MEKIGMGETVVAEGILKDADGFRVTQNVFEGHESFLDIK